MPDEPRVYKVTDAEGQETYVAAHQAQDTLECAPDWDELDHLPVTITLVNEDENITIIYGDYVPDDMPEESEHVSYHRDEGAVEAPAWAWALHFADRAPIAFCSERWTP